MCKANNELIGPEFRLLPPFNVQFSNDTGTNIDCTAFGNPMPQIQWYLGMIMSNKMLICSKIYNVIRGWDKSNEYPKNQNGASEW